MIVVARAAAAAAQCCAVAACIPRDPETLERLLAQRKAELLDARLLIEKPKLQILRAKRDKFGASSERLKQIEQLNCWSKSWRLSEAARTHRHIATIRR